MKIAGEHVADPLTWLPAWPVWQVLFEGAEGVSLPRPRFAPSPLREDSPAAYQLDRRPGGQPLEPFDDDPVSGLQALVDNPVFADPVTDHHRADFRLILGTGHVDRMAVGGLLDGFLGNHDGVRPHRPLQKGLDEHAGTEFFLGVGYFGPDQESPRFLAEGRIGKIHFSSMRVALAVGQFQFHLVGLILGQGESPLSGLPPREPPAGSGRW